MAGSSTKKQRRDSGASISWERARAIFGDADPPKHVWERQFDYRDDQLRRVAATPYREIDRRDLWYYFLDLAYVELQPELFAYLFPVCLMEWHDTLMRNEACSQGDSEFHYGMRRGNIFEKMLTPGQQEQVVEFFRDSFLQRLDAEPATVDPHTGANPFGWGCRFNSLGIILPHIELIWDSWWKVETRGRAVAVLKYCSGLVYFEGENKPFGIQIRDRGRFGPFLWEDDSYNHHEGWLEPNVDFLRRTLTIDYILRKLKEAADRLANEPECELSQQIAADADCNREIVESRIAELPLLLSDEGTTQLEGWSI